MSAKKPMLLVLAGPNGSGKSTITPYFDKVGEYTNADDVDNSTGIDVKEAAKLVDDDAMLPFGKNETFLSRRFYHRNTRWIS